MLAADVADGPGNVLPRYFRRYAPAVREAEKGGPAAAERHRSGPARLTVCGTGSASRWRKPGIGPMPAARGP